MAMHIGSAAAVTGGTLLRQPVGAHAVPLNGLIPSVQVYQAVATNGRRTLTGTMT